MLDGGRQKWLDERRPTVSDVPTITPTTYQAQALNWSLRASSDDVLQSIGTPNQLLVDLRSVEMYHGENKASTVRGGHIPGAVNFPAQREINPDDSFKGWRIPTVQPDGTFKSVGKLRPLFDSVGITANKEIITYCVRGGLSTHAWFVLTQLLGYRNVREYDRSWEEWGNVEALPIELQTWWDYRELDNILLVHFADLLADTFQEIRRLTDFLGIPASDEQIAAIVQQTSLTAMRTRAEQIDPHMRDIWVNGAGTFFYKGTNGRWKEVLSNEELAMYEHTAAKVLIPACRAWLEHSTSTQK